MVIDMKKFIILILLLVFCAGCDKMVEAPLDEGCHFEYTTALGEHGAANECITTKTYGAGIQMFCGGDTEQIEVIRYAQICD